VTSKRVAETFAKPVDEPIEDTPGKDDGKQYSYERYSDAELLSLLADGEKKFVPSAWRGLQREVATRQLALPVAVPEPQLTEEKPAPAGVGGWLEVFQLGIIVEAVIIAIAALMLLPIAPSLVLVSGAAYLATVIVGLLLMRAREPSARQYWISTLTGLTAASVGAALSPAPGIWPYVALGVAMWNASWIPYWSKSARVDATFSREAARED